MEYYAQQCDSFVVDQGHLIRQSGGGEAHIRSHLDLINVAKKLLNISTGQDRAALLANLQNEAATAGATGANDGALTRAMVENALNWATRLVTVVDVGELKCAFSHRRPLLWEHGSLPQFLSGLFTPTKLTAGHVRLETTFNALNLQRLAGIGIEWTSDLASHLSVRNDDTTLLLFHHASFLRQSHDRNMVFPAGFQEETQRTISLLFPANDHDTRRWLCRQSNIDAGMMKCHRLRADDRQIEKFHFWRERLSILKQIFDESEPKTLSQWWFDRRKGPQWYTFWVAIAVLALILLFGLVQSIEGALQVYKAWYPSV